MQVIRANRLFEKLGLEQSIRRSNHFEAQRGRWVIDRAELQALTGFDTVDAAIAHLLESWWPEVSPGLERLTVNEQRALRGIPSQVAAHI